MRVCLLICFVFFNYDPINDKQTLRVFRTLLLCCFFLPSSSCLSVSKQRSGSCYSHSSSALTAAARHVSILHWRRTRRGVNTTVQRERQRSRGGRTGGKMWTETQDGKEADTKRGRECDQNLEPKAQKQKERDKQIQECEGKDWGRCWHGIILWDEEEDRKRHATLILFLLGGPNICLCAQTDFDTS